MDLTSATRAKAWAGVAVNGGIAAMGLRDRVAGPGFLTHRFAQLLRVTSDRKLALAGAALYARSGKPYMKHLSSGGAALGAFALCVAALKTNGAA
jgi:hypothetical protein